VSAPETVTIWIDGRSTPAIAGQSVAAALVASGQWRFSRHPVTGAPRGPYCGMGVCFDCAVTLDGRAAVRACMARVRDGLRVQTAAAEAPA
jgi:predicted molibdopterin-dependent oxidoreductase YjgC